MNNLSNAPAESCGYDSEQDSYISIDEAGVVVDQCPTGGEVVAWMKNHTSIFSQQGLIRIIPRLSAVENRAGSTQIFELVNHQIIR
ncbi:hypothetical protein [Amphritea sp. HPY]|uniref:hypothetical protein n=1 Tax=Amphritea sp. HPY TaxID=3421652 RepID=UPI003D7E7840